MDFPDELTHVVDIRSRHRLWICRRHSRGANIDANDIHPLLRALQQDDTL